MLRFVGWASIFCVGCSLTHDLDSLQGAADASAGGTSPSGGAAGATDGGGSGGASGGAGSGGTAGSGGAAGGGGSGGSVVCGSGQVACGAACVSLQIDPKHCGACGLDCGATTCTSGVCGSEAVVSSQCHGVAVNGSTVYLTRYGSSTSSVAGLYQADVGPSVTLPANATPVAVGSQYLGSASVVHSPSGVFFAVHEGDAVFKNDSTGTNAFFQTANLGPWDVTLAGATLYFTGKGNHIVYRRVASGATATEVVRNDPNLTPRNIAVAGDKAYVTDDVDGKVVEIDTTTKAASTIWSALAAPHGVDAVVTNGNPSVVVTRKGGADVLEKVSGVWTLFKLSDLPPVGTTDLGGGDVVVVAEHAYFTTRTSSAGRLMRRRVDRSAPGLVLWSSDAVDAGGVAATASHVYFCTGSEVRRVRYAL